ncbi:MAG: hypothetical protein PHS51_14400 [Gallionella sp.]|nr:hypothetical protein [Gallionella sp.]
MEKMISERFDIDPKVEKYMGKLTSLLNAQPVKYSEWSNHEKSTLSKAAGIYHFFEQEGDVFTSLYVGKAGFGKSGWSLLKRLNQHFQISQKNALLGKIAQSTNQDPSKIKDALCNNEVFLQWIVLSTSDTMQQVNLESDLVWSECFCKSMLMPKYTNA